MHTLGLYRSHQCRRFGSRSTLLSSIRRAPYGATVSGCCGRDESCAAASSVRSRWRKRRDPLDDFCHRGSGRKDVSAFERTECDVVAH